MDPPVPYSIFPTEISIEILLKIDNLDALAKMCRSSKQVQEICGSEYFWERKYKQDYGMVPKNYQTWKIRYREEYIKYKELITPISCKHGTIGRIAEGKLYMWGKGNRGQLGGGTKSNSTIPIHIPFNKRIVSISCGKDFTGAIASDGLLYMWGKNDNYQLGLGKITRDVTSPVNVKIDGLVRKISCGEDCSALMTHDNTGYIWGLIKVLGENQREMGRYKRPTILLVHVTDISAGFRTVFLVNFKFQVHQTSPNFGVSTLNVNLRDHTSLLHLQKLSDIKHIYTSSNFLNAITTDGYVHNISIGSGGWEKGILKIPPVSQISATWISNTIAAITKDHRLFIAGNNNNIRIPSLPYIINTPIEIDIGYRPMHVSLSDNLICVVTDDGYLNTW